MSRPLRAWRDWCKETSQSFGMDDPEYLEIQRWFEEHSPEGALAFPLLFQGAFYYDAYFWPVQVHLLLGIARVTLEDALQGMPATTKAGLFGNPNDLEDFKALWADCLDYAYGLSELGISENPQELWERLVASGDRELQSAASLGTSVGGHRAITLRNPRGWHAKCFSKLSWPALTASRKSRPVTGRNIPTIFQGRWTEFSRSHPTQSLRKLKQGSNSCRR